MAWFKKQSEGPAVSQLTLARIEAVFKTEGWAYELGENNNIVTAFEDIPMTIMDDEQAILVATKLPTELKAEDSALDVVNWIARRHGENFGPTCHMRVEDDSETVTVYMDSSMLKRWEWSDAQVSDNLVGIIGLVQGCAHEFQNTFGTVFEALEA